MWKGYKVKRWRGLLALQRLSVSGCTWTRGWCVGVFSAFWRCVYSEFLKNGPIVKLASAGAVPKAFTPWQWATCWELPLLRGCKEESLYGRGKATTRSNSQRGFICLFRKSLCLLSASWEKKKKTHNAAQYFSVVLVSPWFDWVKKTFVIVVTEASQACSRKGKKTKKPFGSFSFLSDSKKRPDAKIKLIYTYLSA